MSLDIVGCLESNCKLNHTRNFPGFCSNSNEIPTELMMSRSRYMYQIWNLQWSPKTAFTFCLLGEYFLILVFLDNLETLQRYLFQSSRKLSLKFDIFRQNLGDFLVYLCAYSISRFYIHYSCASAAFVCPNILRCNFNDHHRISRASFWSKNYLNVVSGGSTQFDINFPANIGWVGFARGLCMFLHCKPPKNGFV